MPQVKDKAARFRRQNQASDFNANAQSCIVSRHVSQAFTCATIGNSARHRQAAWWRFHFIRKFSFVAGQIQRFLKMTCELFMLSLLFKTC
jgi:hypothetical protein